MEAGGDFDQAPPAIGRGVLQVRVVSIALIVVCLAALVLVRQRDAQARSSVEKLGEAAADKIDKINRVLVASMDGFRDDPAQLAPVRAQIAVGLAAVGGLRVPNEAKHFDVLIDAVTGAVEAERMFLTKFDDLIGVELVEVDEEETKSLTGAWSAARSSFDELRTEAGVTVNGVTALTDSLEGFLSRYESQADVARSEAEAESERDSELASTQSFYESVSSVLERYADARADLEAQDLGKRTMSSYSDTSAVETALNTASSLRSTIADDLEKLDIPRPYVRHVASIASAIRRGAELVEAAADGADEAYSACNSYSYSTTTAHSCPATLGSSKSYRQFLLSAKDQAAAYDAAVNAFRAAYEQAVRNLYRA